jgi:hypothetical protein
MAYDKQKDKILWEREFNGGRAGIFLAGIYSYDGGPYRVAIYREVPTSDPGCEYKLAPAKRMPAVTFLRIAEAVRKAIEEKELKLTDEAEESDEHMDS